MARSVIRSILTGVLLIVAIGGSASAAPQSFPEGYPTFQDTGADPAIGFEGNYLVTFSNLPGYDEPIRVCLTRGGSYRLVGAGVEWVRPSDAKWHLVARRVSGAKVFGHAVHEASYAGKLRVSPGGIRFQFTGGPRDSGYERVQVEVAGRPGGSLAGRWHGEEKKGTVRWQRLTAKPTRVQGKIIGHPSFTFRMLRHPDWQGINRFADGPVVDDVRLGARPVRIDLGRYYTLETVRQLFTPQSHAKGRGNRSRIELRIFGENLWGRHYVWADPRAGFEVSGYGYVTGKDSRGRDAVVGLTVRIVLWQGAKAGRHALYLDGRPIPFDLAIPGRRAQPLDAPTLNVVVWRYGVYQPLETKLSYYDFFKIRATYREPQDAPTVALQLRHGNGATRIALARNDDGRVFESAPQRLARPALPADGSAMRALRGEAGSRVDVLWSEYVEVTGEAFPSIRSPIDIRGAVKIDARLAGAVESIPVETAPAQRRLRLAVESIIDKAGTTKAASSFALMDAVYDEVGLRPAQKKSIEASLAAIESNLVSTNVTLSAAQRRDLTGRGFVQFDLTAPITRPATCSSERPLIVTAIAPASVPPRDLYSHAKALAEAQRRYKGHLQSIKQAKRAAKAESKTCEPILDTATRIMLSAEFVRVAVEQARRQHADLPARHEARLESLNTERAAAVRALRRAREDRKQTRLFVEFEGTGTSETPKINHVDVNEALERAEVAYDRVLEQMQNDYKQGRSRYRSLAALKKAPRLRKMRARTTWLRKRSEALDARVSTATERARRASEAVDRVDTRIEALKAKRRDAEQRLAKRLDRVRVELAPLAQAVGAAAPTVTDANDLGRILAYARRESAAARQKAIATRARLASAYDEWARLRRALPAHTASVLQVRANTASAVRSAYRAMSESGPYDEFTKTLGRYVQVLNYAPTLILAPTPAHWELATSGKLEDGYRRKLAAMGATTVWDTVFYYSEVADDLRLAGAHLRAQSRALYRFGSLPPERLGQLPISGPSAMSRFKDGFDAYKTTGKVLSLSKGLYDTATQFEKRDPRAAFTGMKNVMTAVDLAGKVANLKGLPGFSLPLRGSLITLHLSLLADAGIKAVEAGNRIADQKIAEALNASLPAPPSKRLYSKDDLVREQYYKTYVDSDDLMQRIATHHQAQFIAAQLAKNPVK